MSSPDVPNVPSGASVAASQQNQYNIPSAIGAQAASNYGQNNAYGSVGFQQTGVDPATGMPIYSANQTLSGPEQAIFNGLSSAQAGAAGNAQNLVASGNYGGSPNIVGTSNSLTNQMMGNYLQSVMPYLNAQDAQMKTQLENEGIMPGAAAGGTNPGDPTTYGGVNTAFGQQMQGLQQSQLQGVAGAAAAFQPQAFNEAVQNYELPLQTAQGLQQFATSPATTMPNSASVAGAQNTLQPANEIAAQTSANQANMAAYQAQMAQQSAMIQGIAGIAGAGLGGWAKGGFQT
jgi:hypothetical protein